VTFFDGEVAQAAQPRSTTSGVGVAEISHRSIRDLLSDLRDGSLDERERSRADSHLARCPDCRSWLDTLRATTGAVGALPREQAPRTLKARLARLPEA
jgi:anti-sigma factor RsiW